MEKFLKVGCLSCLKIVLRTGRTVVMRRGNEPPLAFSLREAERSRLMQAEDVGGWYVLGRTQIGPYTWVTLNYFEKPEGKYELSVETEMESLTEVITKEEATLLLVMML